VSPADRATILIHTGTGIEPAETARIPVLDHGFLFGDSVYDVVRTANGRPFLLERHLDRLRRSGAISISTCRGATRKSRRESTRSTGPWTGRSATSG